MTIPWGRISSLGCLRTDYTCRNCDLRGTKKNHDILNYHSFRQTYITMPERKGSFLFLLGRAKLLCMAEKAFGTSERNFMKFEARGTLTLGSACEHVFPCCYCLSCLLDSFLVRFPKHHLCLRFRQNVGPSPRQVQPSPRHQRTFYATALTVRLVLRDVKG